MIIVDAGFFIAIGNRRDSYHELAIQRMQELSEQAERFITTCAVVTEASYLIFQRGGRKAQRNFIERYQNGLFEVFNLEVFHAPQINRLMDKYADLPMDLADASLVILAEHLGHGRILSTDQRDFQAYRWKNHKPFENLLLPD
ncbi:MAG: PIN domain-containing protein [Gammaproteobacteria bacterium]|nr:PIN domain-containing protein [Gammaproteobacteria bacterium]